ncbi:hypothetical protein N7463_007333 [Penicillium fimorum]|uniref:Uncharacterized protein n=1 Tax=Penicillium fimorum TaxID=1882269 RepID=A0A9W9XW47_9EURO|nr:hypothetical protein N7463_007333 [Penicillium fimorum]
MRPPDSPDRAVLLYTVVGKPWPNTSRVVCDAEGVPLLVLRRAWLSSVRKWGVRLPDQNQRTADLLAASIPWGGDGPGSRVGVGGGFRLEVRFVNALAIRSGAGVVGSGSGSTSGLDVPDEPPPYSAVTGEEEHDRWEEDVGVAQRNEKEICPPFPNSHPHPAQSPIISPPSHTHHPRPPSILPSYDSVRRDSPHSLRDLLDAIEPPQEPAPASPFPSSSQNSQESSSLGLGSGHNAEADAPPGSKVELKVMQLAGSGTGVMMGNQKIMHITRHNVIDYSKSKVKSRPRWEVEVSEGVDLLLAVNIVLIMAETVSSQNKWR